MPEAHPAYQGLPAVHTAELTSYRGRWSVSVIGPRPEVLTGPDDLGPLDAFAQARPGDPGRYLTGAEGSCPVAPLKAAAAVIAEHGYVIALDAAADPSTAGGWTQVCYGITEQWTAPCHPVAP